MRKAILIALLFIAQWGICQESVDFSDEVISIQKRLRKKWNPNKNSIVFTGSSSVRLWNDLQERFPGVQILNTGFGGSQSYDLLGYIDELVLNYKPRKVFIYEGDNDIAGKKKIWEIMGNLTQIANKIHEKQPYTEVFLISAKPSISRWKLRRKYRRLNKEIKLFAQRVPHVTYIDVWNVMLNGRKLNKSLFVEDGLHMNNSGYDLWQEQIKFYVD